MLAARHNCSASIARTKRCGQVIGPSERTMSARARTGAPCPSAPPIRNATTDVPSSRTRSQPRRKFFAGECLSAAVESDDIGARRQPLEQRRSLAFAPRLATAADLEPRAVRAATAGACGSLRRVAGPGRPGRAPLPPRRGASAAGAPLFSLGGVRLRAANPHRRAPAHRPRRWPRRTTSSRGCRGRGFRVGRRAR